VQRTRVGEFEALVLDTSRLRAVVIPELGGRIWELDDLERQRQWIWHREGVQLTASTPGAAYDEVWAGGWEELFPNDAPGRFESRDLPDHGAWWTTAWLASINEGDSSTTIRLTADTRAPNTRCVKIISASAASATLRISYRIESEEPLPFHFLFKQHLPVAVSSSCRLILPGGTVSAVEPGFGSLLPGNGPYRWPDAGGVDLSRIPSRSTGGREFLYVSDLPEAWCAVQDRERAASLRMDFDAATVPFLWLFLSYGGWQECYTAVLEPCTNLPKDLAEAVREGRSARLESGKAFETSVTVTLGGGDARA